MRAAVLHDYGADPVVESFDDPEAAEGRLVLAVGAAGLNPIDLRLASGALADRRPPLPSVVGSEGVGRADDGRRFYFSGTVKPFGAVAERTLVEADGAVEVPEGVEDGQAVACGIAGTAAYGSLIRRGQLREGETVLVLGASGVVGQIAIQAAKLMGAPPPPRATRRRWSGRATWAPTRWCRCATTWTTCPAACARRRAATASTSRSTRCGAIRRRRPSAR